MFAKRTDAPPESKDPYRDDHICHAAHTNRATL